MPCIIQLIEKIIQPFIHLDPKRKGGSFLPCHQLKNSKSKLTISQTVSFKMLTCSFSPQNFLSVLRVKDYNAQKVITKIKGNNAAHSWSHALLCFNMNLMATDFMTGSTTGQYTTENKMPSQKKKKISQVQIFCQGQIPRSRKLLEILILILRIGIREDPV